MTHFPTRSAAQPPAIQDVSSSTAVSNGSRLNPDAEPFIPKQALRLNGQLHRAAQQSFALASSSPSVDPANAQSLIAHYDQGRQRLSMIQPEASLASEKITLRTAMEAIKQEPLLSYYYNKIEQSLRTQIDERQFWPPEYGDPRQCGPIDECIERYHDAQTRYILGVLLYIHTTKQSEVCTVSDAGGIPSKDPDQQMKMKREIRLQQFYSSTMLSDIKNISRIAHELMSPDCIERPTVEQVLKDIRAYVDDGMGLLGLSVNHKIDPVHVNKFIDRASKKESLAHIAANNNNIHFMKAVIDAGLPVNDYDCDGFTPLHRAIQSNAYNIVGFLLKQGVDIDVRSQQGETALQYAIKHFNLDGCRSWLNQGVTLDTLSWILMCGANVNIKFPDGTPPLIYAIERGSVELFKELLSARDSVKNGDLDLLCQKDGKSVLHYAILHPKSLSDKASFLCPIVEKLIDYNKRQTDGLRYRLNFSSNRHHKPEDAECAAILLGMLQHYNNLDNIFHQGFIKYAFFAFVCLMHHDQHCLTHHTPSSAAVSVYHHYFNHLGDDDRASVSAEALKKMMIKTFVRSMNFLWCTEGLQPWILSLPIASGKELLTLLQYIEPMVRSRDIMFQYYAPESESGDLQVGIDQGGLTRQALAAAWYQLFNLPKDWDQNTLERLSLFQPMREGDLYPEFSNMTSGANRVIKKEGYIFLGKLMTLSARFDTPSPVQLSPLLFKRLDYLCDMVNSYQKMRDDVTAGVMNVFSPSSWAGFSVEQFLDEYCEHSPGVIRTILNIEQQSGALSASNRDVEYGAAEVRSMRSMEAPRFELKEALYDWLLEGEKDRRASVIYDIQGLGADIEDDACDGTLKKLLAEWGLPNAKEEALKMLKDEATAELWAPSHIALGIAQMPFSLMGFQILGPYASQAAVCGHRDLRENLLESIVQPIEPNCPSEQIAELHQKRLHMICSIQQFIKQAEPKELEALALFWTGSRQLGSGARLLVTIHPILNTSSENIRSRTCFNELQLPLRLAYSVEGEPLSQADFNKKLTRFLSVPIDQLSQFDFEP